ncbi:MAG: energy-coupling factor transporter transmembrane protein EcfT [Oscillospiraceae bacterium]|jgi:energy-coupling factor transport system permease protein|nr:energy-coupling factor transporter transmembrane protein EcfT [Oscillospiraceae bacterium]
MLKDITLGQFFPGNSIVHRLDPRTKLALTLFYIVALFMCKSYFAFALMAVVLVAIIVASQLNARVILKGLKPVAIIIIVTAILNIFLTPGEPIFEWWIISISVEGIIMAVLMAVRLILLVTGTFMVSYTTSPLALTDAIESLLSPLKKLHFPVHELAMMMSIALRFIPTLIEETDKIMSAQKARGADFETGNILRRAKAMLPILVPLFISAFSRADELADAMESRCYHGGIGRTRMNTLHAEARDYVALLGGVVIIGAVVALNILL